MAVYFAIAFAASLLAFIADRLPRNRHAISEILLYFCAILLFCHFAGARDLVVGTDTGFYAYGSYRSVLASNFDYFWNYSGYASWFAPLFKLLCFGVVSVTHSFYWYLFSIELFTVVPVVVACKKSLGSHAWLGVLVFGIIFYPMSFNMMRQMIGMSFLLLAYLEAIERRPIPFIIFLLIATGFHASLIVGVLLYPISVFSRGRKFNGGVKLGVVVMVGLAFIVALPSLASLLPEQYQSYLGGGSNAQPGGLRTPVTMAGVSLTLGLLGWVFTRERTLRVADRLALTTGATTIAFSLVLLMLSLSSIYLYRVAFIFIYICILLFPQLCCSVGDARSRHVLTLVGIAVMGLWSFDYYIIQGSHEVVPYIVSSMTF